MNTPLISRRAALAAAISTPLAAAVSGRARAADMREVTMAVSSTSFAIGGVRIGQQAGIFERHGVKANIVVMDSGSATMAALISGSAQFVVAGPGEMLASRTHGVDVGMVAATYRNSAVWVVLSKAVAAKLPVKADAPQRERLKAMDGLLIAVPSATSSFTAPIRSATADAGATLRFTYMAQPAMVAALEAGAIDGMVAAFPFAGRPVTKGVGVVWIDGVHGDFPPASMPAASSSMLTTWAYYNAHADIVTSVQQTLLDVAEFIKQRPADARAALIKGYSDLSADEVGLAFDQQKQAWLSPFLTMDDMRQEVKLLRMSVDLPGLATLDLNRTLFPHP
jgi:ABC-type nitrate/sulfonate/bicarbonate transport system substrate-binding protein